MKTEEDIKRAIREQIISSDLASEVSGEIYFAYGEDDDRPKDSKKEDIVIRFVNGETGDVETGVVRVLIYVPDRDTYGDGVLRCDAPRCSFLASLAQRWRESLTADKSNFFFSAEQDVITTDAALESGQHFLSIKLKYKYYE